METNKLKEGNKGKPNIHDMKEMMHSIKVLPRGICGVTSDGFGRSHAESAKIFLDAGIKIVQYREKKSPSVDEAKEIRRLCSSSGALFIVDGRLDIAVASGADGIYMGQGGTSIESAKRQFGGMVGVSATNLGEAVKAQESGADYLGVGAMFATGARKGEKIVPFEEFRRMREKVSLPIYAFGGIKYENIEMVKRLGADGIAIKSAVLSASDPRAALASIIERWSK